jgi:hypothetical protein
MKLTLMALGGYKCYNPTPDPSPNPLPQYMKFTLPSPDSFSVTPRPPPPSAGNGALPAATPAAEYEMTVICINFLHVEEVANLWLDSVKILSDLSQKRPLEVSKNAIFCVKVALPPLPFSFSHPPSCPGDPPRCHLRRTPTEDLDRGLVRVATEAAAECREADR